MRSPSAVACARAARERVTGVRAFIASSVEIVAMKVGISCANSAVARDFSSSLNNSPLARSKTPSTPPQDGERDTRPP
jgi:hypothetical protein